MAENLAALEGDATLEVPIVGAGGVRALVEMLRLNVPASRERGAHDHVGVRALLDPNRVCPGVEEERAELGEQSVHVAALGQRQGRRVRGPDPAREIFGRQARPVGPTASRRQYLAAGTAWRLGF